MNRPAPISVFSDQYRTKSTTRSRTSCGTHTLVRAPQDFFLKRCARPSIRPAPRPWFGSSFPETRSVVVPLDGPAGSCPGRQLRHSRRTLSANGRTPWAAVHAPHRDQKPALYPTSAASGWQPSPLKCSAFALFACRPLRYLNGRTLSPLPAEARQIFHSIDSAKYLLEFSLGQTLCGIFFLRSQRRPALHPGYRAVLLYNVVPILSVPDLPFQNYAATLISASRHRPSLCRWFYCPRRDSTLGRKRAQRGF